MEARRPLLPPALGRRRTLRQSLSRPRALVVAAVALVLVGAAPASLMRAALGMAGVRQVAIPSDTGHATTRPAARLELRARSLTDEVQALVGAMHAPHARSRVLALRLRTLSQARQRVLVQLLAAAPQAAGRLMLRPDARRALAAVRGAAVERSVDLRGWHRVWHQDDFAHPSDDITLDQLVTDTGRTVTLHGANTATATQLTFARLRPNVRLSVRGYQIGDELLVTGLRTTPRPRSLAASTAVAAAPTTLGPVKTAVIVANFADSATSIDVNALKTLFQGNPGNDVVSYFNEASYGKASIVPSFFGPYRLAENTQPDCGSFNTSELIRLADPDIDYTQFKRVIFVGNCTGYGATSSNELPTSTPDGTVDQATIVEDADYSKRLFTQVHELSHTLGGFNRHASMLDCLPDAFIAPTRFDKGCDVSEYGDPFDVLGGGQSQSVGQLDPFHKANAGWLGASQYPTVSSSGTYTLAPYESPGTGIAALNIPRGASGTAFTVEYRQPTGFDTWMGSCSHCTVTQGATIRLTGFFAAGAGGGSDTEIVDTTPGTIDDGGYYPAGDALDAALLPGKSFTDPENGITISAISAGPSGLTVQVTVPSQTCTRAAPRVSTPSPSSQSGSAQSFTSSLTVTDADSAGCPATTFRFLPPGATTAKVVATPDFLTLTPGASTTISLGVTLAATTTTGTYGVGTGQIASNAFGNYSTSVAPVTYQLTGVADSTAPGTPPSAVATALGSGVVRLAWGAATDNVGVVGYRIVRNGSSVFTTAATSFVDSALPASTAYSYSIQSFDANGNLSPAASASATTPARTDVTAPTPPMPTATATDRTISLSWGPSTDGGRGVAAYYISPCLVPQCTLPATATSLQLGGLATQTRYDLTVSAVDADGNIAASQPLTVYTGVLGHSAPSQPQRFYLSSGTSGGNNLTWTAAAGATRYQVYRNNRLYATVSTTTFTDPTSGPHEYFVQALDDAGGLSSPTQRMWGLSPPSASADTTPPTAAVSAPAKGATVGGLVSVTTQTSDNVGVTSVLVYVDGVAAKTISSSPFTYSWDTTRVSNGVHWVDVVATDRAGNYGSDGGNLVTVANGAGGSSDSTPPTVSLAAPLQGAVVSGLVPVSATASDNVGVARVELSVDGSLLKTATATPYGFTWDASGAAPGAHTILARAYDAAGNSSAASVSVTVPAPADTTPPTVSITSPAGGAVVSGGLQVQATAADNVGVTQVELLVDGTSAGTLTAGPWSFTLDTTTLGAGSHVLVARARDAAGNSTSAQVTVLVQNAASDTTAPTKPSGLKAAVTGTTQVALFWAPATDDVGVIAYDVYRDGVKIAETSLPNHLDAGLTAGTSHVYAVRARDAAGNVSVPSSNLNAKTTTLSTAATGTLAGVIYNDAGRPLANAVVQLSGNGIVKSAKTNTSGVYKFSSLAAGQYTLTIAPPGGTSGLAPAGGDDVSVVSGQTVVVTMP